MNIETLTGKLHKRSDKKLKEYCEERFGDLFELCGKHDAKSLKSEAFKESSMCKRESHVWHGAVWEAAKETLFLMLRDKWRDQEVSSFMESVERVNEFTGDDWE